MKKARRLITSLLLFCIVTVTALAGAMTVNVKAQTGEVSRIEWLKQLTGAFNMSVEEKNYPDNYYADISSDYENYYTVMLATEFGLVDVEAGDNFRPDDAATREFAAHTMNVCMGYEPESTGYTFSESGTVTYPDDIQVAIDKGYLAPESGRFNPNKPVTSAEVQAMIAAAKAAYAETQLDDSHNNSYKFKSGVIVLPDGVNAELTDENVITITDCSVTLKTGDMFAIVKDGFPMVKKVKTVSASGNVQIVSTEEVDASDAFESIDIQGTINGDLTQAQAMSENVELSYVVGGTEENNYEDGISYYSLDDVGEEQVDAIVVNQTYDIPENVRKSYDLAKGMKAELTATISNVGADYGYDKGSAFFRMDADVTFTCNVSVDVLNAIGVAPKLELVRVPVAYIGYVKATLDLTAKGSMTFTFVEHVSMGVSYGKSGFRTISDFQKKAFTIQTRAEIGAGVTVAAGFDAVVLKGNVSCSVGGKAIATSDTYSDGKTPTTCVQMNAWMYLYWDYDVKLDLFIYKNSWKGHGDIYTQSNSPVRVSLHYEDGSPVDRCTRDGSTTAGGSGSTGGASTGKKVKYYTPINSQYGYSGLNTGTDSSGKTYTVFDYSLDDDGNATITKYNGNVSALSIPDVLDGHTVVGIGGSVFKNHTELRTVIIPDSVKSIGSDVFYGCKNISSVTLSKSLEKIGDGAFSGCSALTGIEIPKSLNEVTNVQYYLSLRGVFKDCENLKTVTFEAGTTKIVGNLFVNCTGLEKIEIPEGVTSIDEYAFCRCNNLKEVKISGSVTAIRNNVFRDCVSLEQITIPDNVTSIGEEAFCGCNKLNNVKLSKNLVKIGDRAFSECSGLESIEIPKSLNEVTDVQYYLSLRGVFKNCENLKTVTFEAGTTKIPGNLFVNCTGLEKIEIPEGVTSINEYAFCRCNNLKEVKISDSVTAIGNNVFNGCVSLEQVTIPDNITFIGAYAFSGCNKLNNAKLSKNLVKIGDGAFYGCSALTGIEIPKSLSQVTDVEYYFSKRGVFRDCENLKSVIFETGTTKIAGYLFANCPGLETIIIPEGVDTIGDFAFYDCNNLTNVTIPSTLKTIPSYCFGNCLSLPSVVIPQGVTTIDDYAFSACIALEKVSLPNTLETINRGAFNNTALVNVVVPDSVTSMGIEVFSNNKKLVSVTLPNNRKSITQSMFENCTALTSIVLPDTVTNIKDSAFKNCTSLASVTMKNNVTNIGKYAFYNCDALTTVNIPDSVTKIDNYAFSGSDALATVNFGAGLTEIGSYAFDLCQSLNKVVLPYSLTKLNNNAFSNCTKLTEVTINRNVSTIGGNAFSYPDRLTIYGISGTYAETYAGSVGAKFVNQNVPAKSVKLNYQTLELNRNDSVKLVLSVEPANFTDEITWKSSNTDVVTVSADGTVKAAAVGKARIMVYAGNVSAACDVVVKQPVTSISLSASSLSLDAGDTKTLTVSIYPTNAVNKEIAWSSSDEKVAVVDQNGKVTAVGKGSAVISAATKDGSNLTKTCNVTVTGTIYNCKNVSELESKHNYDVNCTDSWVYTVDGASRLILTFDERTEFEENFDFLYIYDKDGAQVGKYTGKALAGKTVTVTGNKVQLKLSSDKAGTAWGFKVTKVETGAQSDSSKQNGLALADDGNWYLYADGKVASGYTGLYNDEVYGWWLVVNGMIDKSYTGLYNDVNCGWWLVAEGRVAFEYNDLYNDANYGWWLITNGSVNFGYTGLFNSPTCGWWLIGGGSVAFYYNDLWNDENCGWWLVNNGTIDFGYTGLYNSPTCGWWLIGGGSIAFYYNDLWNDANCGWWLVSNGTIDFGYTGLYNSPTCGWWLIGGGSIAFYYTDWWNDAAYGTWYINGGTIDFAHAA